ncbi:ABC transporter substrate-binding protein [Teichococcus cervicalis]|uniref:ABC transporter substrate-binding protein n=1 Tax=Teichococcus cervicalis TaxID=204525 RepID=UPI001B7FB610|nr:ABC transporter substrate-binding protein [Pseudoroseomonas cervicalis]
MSPRGSDIGRRRVLAAGLALPLLARPGLLRAASDAPVTVTDLLGRRVSLPRPPRRIVLAQGRLLGTMGLLHPDPVALLAGRASDMAQALPDEEAAWTARFPALRGVPQLGRRILADMSVESVLALQPDLVLLTRGAIAPLDARGGSEVLARLERLGLTAAVVDFMADPLAETLPSLAILGALLDRRDQAAALSAVYRARLAALDALRATQPAAPVPVLLHNNAGGRECCYSIARGSFADFLARMGGRSIAADLLPGALGQLHRETVLVSDAPVYLATGGVYNGRGGVSLGAGISAGAARDSLAAMLRAQGLDALPSVRAGRAHALWLGFNETPLHLVALEALAGWLHPALAPRLSPERLLERIDRDFSALPMQGSYWTSLA